MIVYEVIYKMWLPFKRVLKIIIIFKIFTLESLHDCVMLSLSSLVLHPDST